MPRGKSDLSFERMVPTGSSYDIEVRPTGFRRILRKVRVERALAVARVNLIPEGWPYYFMGGIEMPLQPRPRFAAVAVRGSLSTAEIGTLAARALSRGFRMVTLDPDTREPLDNVDNSVLYFEPVDANVSFFSFAPDPSRSHDRVPPDAVVNLKSIFSAYAGRIGALSNVNPGTVRIVDAQFIVRFDATVSEDEVRRFAESIHATQVRAVDRASGSWLIEFNDPQNIGRHLEAIAGHLTAGNIASGEPNLLFQFELHSGPQGSMSVAALIRMFLCQTMPMNDPFENCQNNLDRQGVRDAWCFLEDVNPEIRYGSSAICVATIDTGITFDASSGTSSQQDVDTSHLKYCYDIESDGVCSEEPALAAGKIHGMAVYGIIAGKADNDFGISGIAPNTTHLAVKFVSVIQDTENYAATLEWIGGIRETAPPRAPGAPPPDRPADIINCSHGLEGDPTPDAVRLALKRLTNLGRGGRGTIVVYSAGNRDCYIGDDTTLATLPCTIGVANTEVAGGTEFRWRRPQTRSTRRRGSNFSPFLDLCANGQDAPSLEPGDVVVDPVCAGKPGAGAGVYMFEATSAAAAMVSGAAALVLTANKELNWSQVANILCATAEKVDCANDDDIADCEGVAGSGRWRSGRFGLAPPQPPECSAIPKGRTWFSDFYGYGRLDVSAAVKLAREVVASPAPTCS